MTAEADIAALTDGGQNPISEIRTALTSVLARADGMGVRGSMYLTSDVTVAENPIDWDAIGDDVGGAVDLVNNGFVAQVTGIKMVTIRLVWTATIPDDMDISLQIDGVSTDAHYLIRRFKPGTETFRGHISTIPVWVAAGELLTAKVGAGTQVGMRGHASRGLATEILYFET